MDSNYSLADVAAAAGNSSGLGGEGLWIFALLLLLFGANGFNGNNSRVGEQYATQADISRAVDSDAMKTGFQNAEAVVRSTSADTVGSVKDVAYSQLGELRDLQNIVSTGFANQQTCCCETKQAILENRYIDAQNTSAIQASIAQSDANTTAQVQKVLDAMTTNRMADMQNQINTLQLQLATASTVKYPTASTYTAGSNPYCSCTGLATI